MTIIMVSMAGRQKFELIYAPITKRHLRAVESKHYSLIRHAIETHLRVEPDVETRNRKPLRRPVVFGATWEIRFGPNNRLRVFYRVSRDERRVEILAIGEKAGKRLLVGREEIQI